MTYVTLFETNKLHTDPNLETCHNALVEISLISSSENVVFVTCHMSLIFFLEKWSFQILLVSFSVTCDTMRGNTVPKNVTQGCYDNGFGPPGKSF